jgi:hypothetical protein
MTNDANPDQSRTDRKECLEFFGRFVAVIVLLNGCVVIPALAVHFVHPLAGVFFAIMAFVTWARFGPRSMPGFVSGIVCIFGFAAIIGTLIACIGTLIRWLAS